MAHGKERSSLFKFFYTILRVITFPIFAVLYVLKHPLWVLCLLFVLCGAAVYYPLQFGVKLEDVPQWYKKKYTEVKYEVVAKAVESGDAALFSQDMLEDLADEIDANKGLKNENYNAKVSRNKTMDNVASDLKKRGGFKRKKSATDAVSEEQAVSDVEPVSAGGLEALLSDVAEKAKTEEQSIDEEMIVPEGKPVLQLPTVEIQSMPQQNSDDVIEDELDLF